MSFRFQKLEIPDAVIVEPSVFADTRGYFMETYKHSDFASIGIEDRFVQENHSCSSRQTLRGLHYQKPPRAQAKLVRVVVGVVFDVIVDLRKASPACGRWQGVTLSAENKKLLYVPAGCAHGFCVLSEVAEVVYKVTEEYAPEHEAGIRWNDPGLAIRWPVNDPILSSRDRGWPSFQEAKGHF